MHGIRDIIKPCYLSLLPHTDSATAHYSAHTAVSSLGVMRWAHPQSRHLTGEAMDNEDHIPVRVCVCVLEGGMYMCVRC